VLSVVGTCVGHGGSLASSASLFEYIGQTRAGLANNLVNFAPQLQITASTASRHTAHRLQHSGNGFVGGR
jgi:hypothetical protein